MFCVQTVVGGRDARGYGRWSVLFFVETDLLVLLVVELEALADACLLYTSDAADE